MQVMALLQPNTPLVRQTWPDPEPQDTQVLLDVVACGVCRTDLHIVDGELTDPKLPLVPGHQIVGRLLKKGAAVAHLDMGQRVGVPWLGWTCGSCTYCQNGMENLCERARFTGYQIDGGFAAQAVADARYCFALPDNYDDLQVAPLLCAGLIGYRSLRKAGDAQNLGLYGFGAAAHIVTQVAVHEGRRVFAFTRRNDTSSQQFALQLGAHWVGASDERPSELLDAAIIFAPVGSLVPAALEAVRPGGVVVCAGIHMSPIPSFSYDLLWGERQLVSVANLTRQDGEEFLRLAPEIPIRTHVQEFALSEANEALAALRRGALEGAAVLRVKRG